MESSKELKSIGTKLEKEPVDEILDNENVVADSRYNVLFSFFSREIDKYPRLTKEREMAATKKELINHNFRLLIYIARGFLGNGLPLMDLIQEGYAGLARAAEKFEPERDYRFSVCAGWWIWQAIAYALSNKSRTIRIPMDTIDKISQLKQTEEYLYQNLGRPPADEEIAKKMELQAVKVRELKVIRNQLKSISLSTLIFKHNSKVEPGDPLEDFVEDKNAKSPEEEFILKENQKIWFVVSQALGCDNDGRIFQIVSERNQGKSLQEILERLEIIKLTNSERLFYILARRKNADPDTLEKIGKEFGITKERTRQLQNQALKKLQHPTVKKQLEEFR